MTNYGISDQDKQFTAVRGYARAGYAADCDLPEPPDNFDIWNSFPENFRDRVTNQFTNGIDQEYDLIRARVSNEYAVARARQNERDARRTRSPRGRL